MNKEQQKTSRRRPRSNKQKKDVRQFEREKPNDGFGSHWKRRNVQKLDPRCQEATPELLRIEIDNIFQTFLSDPDTLEYIFPSDLNNLQRKYIHDKAQKMNVISKSYGKEPDRHLHIKKKAKQLASQTFHIKLSVGAQEALHKFNTRFQTLPQRPNQRRVIKRYEKVYGKLLECPAAVPKKFNASSEITAMRSALPIYERRQLVIDAINANQVVIISSETGSGKTTQVPQYILEEFSDKNLPCKIVCTQPRRISTVSAAERVSYERNDTIGSTVGYHIRLEQKSGLNTNIIYCTVGVFLRNLMCGPQCLTNITHVIIDEIHERDKLSDFLLICLRQNLKVFPHLRVILMSATVNTKKFEQYFGSGVVLAIPGRLHPIENYFLEDILHMLEYWTPKMREGARKVIKEQQTPSKAESLPDQDDTAMPEVDIALEEYLNFSDNYDYTLHYEEATAQLSMYFVGEDIPVDYRHSTRGLTALMIAAHLGDKEFASRLCNMGAKLDVCDAMGKTALDYAQMSGKNDIVRLLEFIKVQSTSDVHKDNTDKAQYLLKLYDNTTTDDFIDHDLIVSLIEYIHKGPEDGSILIFLPGYDDIMMCNDRILDSRIDPNSYKIYYLHSSMNIKDQCDVFRKLPNQRKIILSTNIAETSITIEDVVFVIDVGKAKEKVYDSYNKLSSLQTQWISQACAKQRSGRAGRVRKGYCFRLYSHQRFENMNMERVPEILRVSLEELCLHTKIIAPPEKSIHDFLSLAPDPPSANSVKVAIEHLQALGALDKEEDLTVLGEYLSQITVEPRIGKMLIWGVMFQCLEPILTLAAALAHKDPFQLPPQANLKNVAIAKRKELTEAVLSDQLIFLKVFQQWQEETYLGRSRSFCERYFVSEATLISVLDTRRQLLGQLRATGFIHNAHSIEEFNVNCHSWPTVKAVMCSAFYPNVAYPNGSCLATKAEKKVVIHNTSVCCNNAMRDDWLFYDEMVKNRVNFSIKGTTVVTAATVALMCGIDITTEPPSISFDEFVQFDFEDEQIVRFRSHVDNLVRKILENPWNGTNQENSLIVATLRTILESEELKSGNLQAVGIGVRPKFFTKLECFERKRFQGNLSRQNQNIASPRASTARHFNNGALRPRPNDSGFNDVVANRNSNRTPVVLFRKNETSATGAIARTSNNNSYWSGNDGQYSGSRQRGQRRPSRNIPGAIYNGMESLSLRPEGREDVGATSLHYYDDQAESATGRTSGNNERFGDYLDDPMYFLIKANTKKNTDIALVTNKWVFSPQTEKKVLHFWGQARRIFLIFYVREVSSVMGLAEFHSLNVDANLAKPTARISWAIPGMMNVNRIRHLRNPYDPNKPIYESADGMVIEKSVAEEVVRILTECFASVNNGEY